MPEDDPELRRQAALRHAEYTAEFAIVPTVSSLSTPRQLTDPITGLPALTSLFQELAPMAELPEGLSVYYIHVPSSYIVEERFGWEALEAYRSLMANYLAGMTNDMRRDRGHSVLARIFADDFVLLAPYRDGDDEISGMISRGVTRHMRAMDEETAAILQVFVGARHSKPFPKIHSERRLYRTIQETQTEATDVSRQMLMAQVRVLDRCVQQRQFNMVYQPIVKVAGHGILAHEALVRCPVDELRNPHILFNVAEQGDRIWPLSRVLRRLAIDGLPQMPPEQKLFLNVHPRDFDDPDLYETDGPLAQNADRIVLEVTERVAILDMETFLGQLQQLRDFGLDIAIDDLGSGYSALNLVAELDPDFIKLDMTLVRDVHKSPVRQNLLRSMVGLAQDLNAQVVAEGVETRDELEVLADLGCELVQGYYLAKPSPPFVTHIDAQPAR